MSTRVKLMNPPKAAKTPIKFADEMLTFEDCARDAKVHISTIRHFVNHPRKSLRLPVVVFGYRTKRVRMNDWNAYKAQRLTPQ